LTAAGNGAREPDRQRIETRQADLLFALGKKRCPRIKIQTGVIVAYVSRSNAMRVLLDGSKAPMTLHKSYMEPQ
jgi:hypothetical protein